MVKKLIVADYLFDSEFDGDLLVIGHSCECVRKHFQNDSRLVTFSDEDYESMRSLVTSYYVNLPWDIRKRIDFFKSYGERYWLFPHTEKSLWISEVPHLLFYLRQFQAIKSNYQEIEFRIKNQLLHRVLIGTCSDHFSFLKYVRAILKQLVKFIFKWMFFKFYVLKNDEVRERLIITMYPECLKFGKDGSPREIFLGEKIFSERDWACALTVYDWKVLISSVWRDRSFLRNNFFFVESRLRLADIKCLFSFSDFKNAKRVAQLHKTFYFEGTDVTELVKWDILRSFYSGGYFSNLFLAGCFSRVSWGNYQKVFYRLEFQPIECTFLMSGLGKTKFFGLQHSAFGKNFFNYIFPDGIEDFRLAPDVALVTGNRVGREFSRFKDTKIVTVGPTRFQRVFKHRDPSLKEKYRKELGIKTNETFIFLPISQFLDETLNLLNELCNSLKEIDRIFHIKVKINPNKKKDLKYIQAIRDSLKRFSATTELIIDSPFYYEYIKAADYMVTSGGTAAIEGAFVGTSSIIFETRGLLVHNPMAEYKSVFAIAYNMNDMKSFLQSDFKMDMNERTKMMNDLFGGIEDNAEEIFLRSIGNE